MAILKIARMGHPVLKQAAAPVADPTAPELGRLIMDMLETMEDAEGTGLAAPQIYVPKRIVAFYVSGARAKREDGEEQYEAHGHGEHRDAHADQNTSPLLARHLIVFPRIDRILTSLYLGFAPARLIRRSTSRPRRSYGAHLRALLRLRLLGLARYRRGQVASSP